MSNTYVVMGASGNTGKAVATALLAAKQSVRVIVRDAAKGADWKARGAEVAVADVSKPAELAAALRGAAGAYVMLPPPAWNATGVAARSLALRESIAAAVADAKPAHVVQLSSIGAQHASGTGRIEDLHDLEAKLRKTGVPTTFLRAGFFLENWDGMAQGAIAASALYYASPVGLAFPQVAAADIGKAAAKLLVEGAPKSGERIVQIAGPKEASTGDVAAILTKLAGKPINAVEVPTAGAVQAMTGMGASQEVAEGMGGILDGLKAGKLTWTDHETVRGTVTLEQHLRAVLGK